MNLHKRLVFKKIQYQIKTNFQNKLVNNQVFVKKVYYFLNLDLQKLLNLSNYTPEQLGEDFENQKKKLRARERRAPNKASDYGKDPSQIKVKDKEGKAVVSKFRQI